jgi:Putative zinc-finger
VAKKIQFGSNTAGMNPNSWCAQCEEMLADALDGTLGLAEQAFFDVHMQQCGPCSQMLADAQRGAAWLEMLRDPKPEPSAMLLERILAQTSGAAAVPFANAASPLAGPAIAALVPGYAAAGGGGVSNVLPFPRRVAAWRRVLLQPRLAMTAAMAFFSIALTMNLTGVRVQDLRASNLRPASLKRDFYSANARVVQYYEGMRVVYELESRVHDLQAATENDAPAATPSTQPESQPQPNRPATQPEQRQQRTAPASGTSRRESERRAVMVALAAGPQTASPTASQTTKAGQA